MVFSCKGGSDFLDGELDAAFVGTGASLDTHTGLHQSEAKTLDFVGLAFKGVGGLGTVGVTTPFD
jgi:hypothetical protein